MSQVQSGSDCMQQDLSLQCQTGRMPRARQPARLVHVAAEELVVALEALHKALGRQDARLAFLRLDLRTSSTPGVFPPGRLLMRPCNSAHTPWSESSAMHALHAVCPPHVILVLPQMSPRVSEYRAH